MSTLVYFFGQFAACCVRCESQSGFAVERGMRGKKKRSGPSRGRAREAGTTRHCVTQDAAKSHKRVTKRSRALQEACGNAAGGSAKCEGGGAHRRWEVTGRAARRAERASGDGAIAPSRTRSGGAIGDGRCDDGSAKRRRREAPRREARHTPSVGHAERGSGARRKGGSRSSPRQGPAPGGSGSVAIRRRRCGRECRADVPCRPGCR